MIAQRESMSVGRMTKGSQYSGKDMEEHRRSYSDFVIEKVEYGKGNRAERRVVAKLKRRKK